MSDPKDIPFPFTAEELQEKIRNGEFRVEMAFKFVVPKIDTPPSRYIGWGTNIITPATIN